MAPTIRSFSLYASLLNTDLYEPAVLLPLPGDTILHFAMWKNNGSGVPIVTPPEGWTEAFNTAAGNVRFVAYYKIAGASEVDETWTGSVPARSMSYSVAVFDGAIFTDASQIEASADDALVPSIDVPVGGGLLVNLFSASFSDTVNRGLVTSGLIDGQIGSGTGVASVLAALNVVEGPTGIGVATTGGGPLGPRAGWAVLFTTVAPAPAPAPAPTPMASGSGRDRLGCGINRAHILWKGGEIRFCSLDKAESIYWSRTLNEVSEAEVILHIQQNDLEDCCACLGDIEPWCHELHIERDGEVVWQGPVIDVVYENDKVTIKAQDVLAWADVRIAEGDIGDGVFSAEWTAWAHLVLDTAFIEDDPNVLDFVYSQSSGFIGINKFDKFTDTALQQLITLSQTGIDFSVVNRSILILKDEIPSRPVATLRDSMILGNVKLRKDGKGAATRWFVHFKDDLGSPAFADAPQQCYGLIERMLPEDEALYSVGVAEETANIYVNATKTVPRIVEIEDDSQLSPEAAWTIQEMIPGSRVDVVLSKLCVPAIQSYRLTSMGVLQTPETEKVSVTLGSLNIQIG